MLAGLSPLASGASAGFGSDAELRWKKIIRLLTQENLANRPGSDPFLSGDTFRSRCEIIVEKGRWFRNRDESSHTVFAESDEIDTEKFLRKVERLLRRWKWAKPKLLVHNGDHLPRESSFSRLANIFSDIFAVNVVDPDWPVTPIPIGLENAHHRKNGRVDLFADERPGFQTRNRPRSIGVSFRSGTNGAVRLATRRIFESHGVPFQEPTLSPEEYVDWVRQSKFIVSPPGNGNDCHRTWEALYLGAIPIVLRGYLSDTLIDSLPIWAVESWHEVIALTPRDLDAKYSELVQKDQSRAFFDYWFQRVFEGRQA